MNKIVVPALLFVCFSIAMLFQNEQVLEFLHYWLRIIFN